MLQDVAYALNQRPIHGLVLPIVKIHRAENQEMEVGTIIPSDTVTGFFFLSILMNLFFVGLRVLVSMGRMLPQGDILKWKPI